MATGNVKIQRAVLAKLADKVDDIEVLELVATAVRLSYRDRFKTGKAKPRRLGLAKLTAETKAALRTAMLHQTEHETDQDLADRFGTTAARVSELRGSIADA